MAKKKKRKEKEVQLDSERGQRKEMVVARDEENS